MTEQLKDQNSFPKAITIVVIFVDAIMILTQLFVCSIISLIFSLSSGEIFLTFNTGIISFLFCYFILPSSVIAAFNGILLTDTRAIIVSNVIAILGMIALNIWFSSVIISFLNLSYGGIIEYVPFIFWNIGAIGIFCLVFYLIFWKRNKKKQELHKKENEHVNVGGV